MKQRVIKFTCLIISAVFFISAKTYYGNPSNYLEKRDSIQAGDSLVLEAGDYTSGLGLTDMHGAEKSWIVITAQEPHTAVLVARDWNNTINMKNCSYIKIVGLKFDGMNYNAIDAIKAQGGDTDYTHHIWIENNIIQDHGGGQQTVGISTKITSWDWTIRKNKIIEAGTGIYLGNSDGSMPFVRGLIEFNLILNPIGYCMQIKHQNDRPDISGIPMEDVATIIRHNVFAKDDRPSPDGDRPNLLVSGTFEEGPGSEDRYEIYGNFLFYNSRENLFQGSGNISLHNNIFAVSEVRAINFQEHHERKPKELFVYCNTIYNTNSGILLSGADTNYDQIFKGNAVYTASPVSGITDFETDNKIGTVADAVSVFVSPSDSVPQMDFYPLAGALLADVDLSSFSDKDEAWNRDFNDNNQDGSFYGAYSGEGANPGWKLALDIKELGVVSVKKDKPLNSNNFILKYVYVNPFTKSIDITYALAKGSYVKLNVYTINGRLVKSVINKYMRKGKHTIHAEIHSLSNGMYFVKLQIEDKLINRKVIILRH